MSFRHLISIPDARYLEAYLICLLIMKGIKFISMVGRGRDIVLCIMQLPLATHVYHRSLKLAHKIAGLARREEIPSIRLSGK